jgi:hypothetical protein
MRETEQDIRAKYRLNTRAVIYAGLVVGLLFLFLPRGIPWNSLGLPTEAMGRPLFSEDTITAMFITGVVQILLALGYTFVIASVVYRFRTLHAVLLGGLIGIGLYGLNYLIFQLLFNAPTRSESAVFITHLAFCCMAAGAYKGFSTPRPRSKEAEHPI